MKIKLPLIFLHFSRTGGYTLNEVLKAKFKENERYGVYVPEKGGIPKIVEENFINLPESEKKKYKFIYGHFFFGLHSFYNDYTYYTLLRDPVARVVSMYGVALTNKEYYLHDYIIKNKILLKDLLQSNISPEFNNGMVRALAGIQYDGKDCNDEIYEIARQNLDEHFICYGITERFFESVALLNVKFGISAKIFKEKLNTKRVNLSYIFDDKALIELIRDRNKYDIKLYEYALEKFNTSIESNKKEVTEEVEKLREFHKKINKMSSNKILKMFVPFYVKLQK